MPSGCATPADWARLRPRRPPPIGGMLLRPWGRQPPLARGAARGRWGMLVRRAARRQFRARCRRAARDHAPGRTGIKAKIEITERAAIGDELRIPLAWCEMGSCISHYADPAALGEADIRTRAIASGWRVDALGRLACPQCQQGDSWFWTAHPVALWDRDTAVAMTTLMAAAVREIAGADGAAGMERDAPPGSEPGAPLGRERAAPLGGEPGAIPGGEPGAIPGAVPGPGRRWPVRRAGDGTVGTLPTLTVPSDGSDTHGNGGTDSAPGRSRRLPLADARGRDGRPGGRERGPEPRCGARPLGLLPGDRFTRIRRGRQPDPRGAGIHPQHPAAVGCGRTPRGCCRRCLGAADQRVAARAARCRSGPDRLAGPARPASVRALRHLCGRRPQPGGAGPPAARAFRRNRPRAARHRRAQRPVGLHHPH